MDSEINRSQNTKLSYEKCNHENINNAMMMKLTKIKLLHSFKTFKYTSVTCQLLFYYLNNLISRVEADLAVNKNDCCHPCKSISNTRAIDACMYIHV